MDNLALVFPGQGAQRPGMGLDFAAKFPQAQMVFERANDALPFDVLDIIENDERQLNLTEFTQPCILSAEIAMFEALKAHYGVLPACFGGHSLGEYAALVAANAMPLEAAVRLVHLRGQLMQQAVPPGQGAMAAIIQDPLPIENLQSIADACQVDVANDNSPNQVVISGRADGVENALKELQPLIDQGLRVVPLTVSAPFHSRCMAEIEPEFRAALEAEKSQFNAECATVVTSNFLGGFHSGNLDDLINALTCQISGTVRWRDNMTVLSNASDTIVEVGPNRPLRGFFKAIGVSVKAVIDLRSADKAFERVGEAPQEVS